MNRIELAVELSSLNFTALDVETANEQYDSLCSIGIVRIEKGSIVEERSYRIRPRVLRLAVMNSQIHKLTEEDLKNEPEITDVWQHIQSLLVDRVLVAHSASFDIEVLQRSLRGYGLEFPGVKYLCSLKPFCLSVSVFVCQLVYSGLSLQCALTHVYSAARSFGLDARGRKKIGDW